MGLFSGPRRPGGALAPRSQRASQNFGISGPGDLIPPRPFLRPNWPVVTNDTALRHSAVWACLRVRADLISTLPVDVYARVAGIQVQRPKPPVLLLPGGPRVDWLEWCYSTQFDLDRAGNAVGLIAKTDGYGLPKVIELQDINTVTVQVRDGQLSAYKIGNTLYDPVQVWHEKQFTVGGMHVGLSPVGYARWAIGEYLTVQEFATNWFGSGAVPKARLKNTAKILSGTEISTVKEAWRAALAADEPFVTGSDWDYEMLQAAEASADWIEAKKFSVTDLCRFFGVPSDMIDSTPTGQTRAMTYANVSQRNLQFLIINLGPAVIRRETALSRLLPAPQYAKLNADALLRLDPISRANVISTQVTGRVLAPSEGRELENRPPFTDAQLAEFDRLFGPPLTGTGSYPAGPVTGPGPDAPLPEGDLIPPLEELARRPVPALADSISGGSPFAAANGRHP